MAPHSSQHDFSLTDVGVKTQWNAELRPTENIFSCPHATIALIHLQMTYCFVKLLNFDFPGMPGICDIIEHMGFHFILKTFAKHADFPATQAWGRLINIAT